MAKLVAITYIKTKEHWGKGMLKTPRESFLWAPLSVKRSILSLETPVYGMIEPLLKSTRVCMLDVFAHPREKVRKDTQQTENNN